MAALLLHKPGTYHHALCTSEQLRPQDIRAAELVEQVIEADELFQKGVSLLVSAVHVTQGTLSEKSDRGYS